MRRESFPWTAVCFLATCLYASILFLQSFRGKMVITGCVTSEDVKSLSNLKDRAPSTPTQINNFLLLFYFFLIFYMGNDLNLHFTNMPILSTAERKLLCRWKSYTRQKPYLREVYSRMYKYCSYLSQSLACWGKLPTATKEFWLKINHICRGHLSFGNIWNSEKWKHTEVEAQKRVFAAREAFTYKRVCISGLLCMRVCPHAEMGAMHNVWRYTEQHSLVYHESRWTSLHTLAPRTAMVWRWGGSAVYMIICLGRPLLWTICRLPLGLV